MNTNKHTPEDLVRVLRNCANEGTRINEAMESASMELDWSDTPDNERLHTESKAVSLMFAAPELLAALERVLECHRLKISLDTNAGAVEQARAAIAKAKGE